MRQDQVLFKPSEIRPAEINTNVYGVLGIDKYGIRRPIRAYRALHIRADEGIDLYCRADAVQEAQEIGQRNKIPVGTGLWG